MLRIAQYAPAIYEVSAFVVVLFAVHSWAYKAADALIILYTSSAFITIHML